MAVWDSVKEEEEVVSVKTEEEDGCWKVGCELAEEGSKRKRVRRAEAKKKKKKRSVVARWSAER